MPDVMQESWESPLKLWDAYKADGQTEASSKAPIGVNSNVPCNFETAGFVGQVLFYVDGLPSSPSPLFEGRKRRTHLLIKVRIKETLCGLGRYFAHLSLIQHCSF